MKKSVLKDPVVILLFFGFCVSSFYAYLSKSPMIFKGAVAIDIIFFLSAGYMLLYARIILFSLLMKISFLKKTRIPIIASNLLRVMVYCAIYQFLIIGPIIAYANLTPHALFDSSLNYADTLLGFNSVIFTTFMYNKLHYIYIFFSYIYSHYLNILVVVGVSLGTLISYKHTERALILFITASIISMPIIYFMPAAGPMYLHHSLFSMNLHVSSYLNHYLHSRAAHIIDKTGDNVTFPSYHVLLTLVSGYCLYVKNIYFKIFAILSVALISISTLVLAEHYLVDVILSFILFFGANAIFLIPYFKRSQST